MLAALLPAFELKLRVRERRHPKLYWTDPGIVRAAKRHHGSVGAEERGPLLEGWIFTIPSCAQRNRLLVRRHLLLGAQPFISSISGALSVWWSFSRWSVSWPVGGRWRRSGKPYLRVPGYIGIGQDNSPPLRRSNGDRERGSCRGPLPVPVEDFATRHRTFGWAAVVRSTASPTHPRCFLRHVCGRKRTARFDDPLALRRYRS